MTITRIEKSGCRIFLLLIAFAMAGCIEQAPVRSGDELIRIGENTATLADFEKALDNAKSAYSRGTLQDPAVFKQIRLAVLNQMIEEMVIREVAKTHNIEVTDGELDTAVISLKQDYPGGEFDRVLLESAVSFESWKERLKMRLLAEKVAEGILGDHVVITRGDIAAYYKMLGTGNNTAIPGDRSDAKEDEAVLAYLHKVKIEKAYTIWMNNLKKEMPIEINEDQWGVILGIQNEDEQQRQVSTDEPQSPP